ncbi:MAG: alpha/beta hydrolase [Marinoscillum sp.]
MCFHYFSIINCAGLFTATLAGRSSQLQSVGNEEQRDTTNAVRISDVQNPTIEVYLPSKSHATKQAVLICPGGGYSILAYDKEGTDIAKMLNGKGIAGIVLKYRLPKSKSNIEPHKSALMDAQQGMKLVRANAEKWNIDPANVGVMGFSAGGHLASTLGTHFDEESRPNFMVLVYPVVSMDKGITHMGSRTNLIGKDPTEEMITLYSNELQVKPNTPPTFIVHSSDDGAVPVENSLRLFKNIKDQEIPIEMHIYSYGGHGYGLAIGNGRLATWPDRLIDWLRELE